MKKQHALDTPRQLLAEALVPILDIPYDQIIVILDHYGLVFKKDAIKAMIGFLNWCNENPDSSKRATIIHDLNLRNDRFPETCGPRTSRYIEFYKP